MSNHTSTSNQAKPQLTAQQGAIVGHNHGPALVFAVAGAGKTTAMAHRIGRLVADRVFPPPPDPGDDFQSQRGAGTARAVGAVAGL